ncbi:MAG: hypothetical protein QGG42_14260 [Phycisphaerae bacterium]|jgi:hypothetical protein|nr:hypothetical protein [Phycisphaerae bacterium]
MINTPTVLLLGAGASMPFKFPSGPRLLYDVVNTTKGRKGWLAQTFGLLEQEIEDFGQTLFRSGVTSVDAFLEHRRDLVDLGKILIALCLTPHEVPDRLWAEGHDTDNWYKLLFRKMNAPFQRFGENNLSVITYNYDRSLEYFLHTSLMNLYGQDSDACWSQLDKIPIVHLHGQLADLRQRPYSGEPEPGGIRQSADGIRIIHEDMDDDPQFKQAHQMLIAAERVYFVGFGYHPDNIRRLNMEHAKEVRAEYIELGSIRNNHQRVLGTVHGFTGTEIANLKKRTSNLINFVNTKSVGFFRNNAPLD